jgi:hypothetical protein
MSVDNILASPEEQAFATSLAAKYNIAPAAAQSAMAGLLPSLITGIEHGTLSRDGIAELMQTMAGGQHYNVIANPDAIGHPDTVADGNAIIGKLMGPSGLSQSALQGAAAQSGVPVGLLGGMAPMIAVFLIGWLFRNAGGMLGSVLSNAAGSTMGGAGGGPSIPSVPQMPYPRSGGGAAGPLSLPDIRNFDTSRNNPYGNIANSINRGGSAGGAMAGGVRDILGNLLGFGSNSGIVGWIIRYFVLRYGMTVLRGVLRTAIGGR